MKTTPLILCTMLALGATLATAQEAPPPAPVSPPPTNAAPPHPPEPDRAPPATPPVAGPRPEHRGERREGGPRFPEAGRRGEGQPRGEGERRPEGGPRPESGRFPVPPPAPSKPTPYLGVITQPLPAVLSAQLGLKEGFGLVVAEVLPESPAALAGVRKYDVLTKFNDQQLVDAGQFSTLVRAAGKDAEATVTVLREAKEEKLPVKIGERLLPERRPFPGTGEWQRQMEQWKGPAAEAGRRAQEAMKGYGEKMRDYQERLKGFQQRMKEWQKNPSAEMPQPPEPPQPPALHAGGGGPINPADILAEAQPGGARQIRLFTPDGNVAYHTAETKVLVADDSGSIEISTKDGRRVLLAKGPQGEPIFDGPIETEEQRKALPEEVRKKLQMIQVRANSVAFEAPAFIPPGAEPEVQ